jgi:hypothetical protein
MTTWLSNTVVDHLRVVATWPELPGDRYVIERPIGRGGMGTVYVARDTLLERDVAIKVSNAPVAGSGLDERCGRRRRCWRGSSIPASCRSTTPDS